MYVVALTGGICSGKSTVANVFMQLGISIVDADVIAKKILSFYNPQFKAIIDHFGTKILNSNGTINRNLLRKIIFSYENERIWINNLLHPVIKKETERQIYQAISPYVLWVTPLLFENNLYQKANHIIVINIRPENQIKRVIMRDKISYRDAINILSVQAKNKDRLAIANDIINNDGNQNEIKLHVYALHKKFNNYINKK